MEMERTSRLNSGEDFGDAIVRARSVESSRQGKIALDQTFLNNAPDEWIDTVIAVQKKYAPKLAAWPKGAQLKIHVRGDRGAYCESDTRSFVFTLKWPVNGSIHKFEATADFTKRNLQTMLAKNIERLDALTSFA